MDDARRRVVVERCDDKGILITRWTLASGRMRMTVMRRAREVLVEATLRR